MKWNALVPSWFKHTGSVNGDLLMDMVYKFYSGYMWIYYLFIYNVNFRNGRYDATIRLFNGESWPTYNVWGPHFGSMAATICGENTHAAMKLKRG